MKLIFGEARKPCPYFSSRALIEPCFKMSVFRKKLIACHIYDIYDTYTAGTQNAQCITNIEKNCSICSKNVSKAKFVHRMISLA